MTAATFDIKANDKTKDAFNSVTKKLKGLSVNAVKAAGALAAISGAALTGLGLSSARSADALAKHADKIGITTEKLAALQYMTEQYTGVGLGAMSEALTKAEKRLGEFVRTGGGAAATWLKTLNLDVEHLKSLSPDQLFQTYAESIRGLNTRGEQLAATSALMGDESRALINIIDAGPEAFRNAEKEAKAFGLTISRIDAAKIEAAGDAVDKVQQVFKGVGNKLAIKFSAYIEEIANRFNDAAFESDGFGASVESAMKTAVMSVAYLGDVIRGLEVTIKLIELAFAGFAELTIDAIFTIVDGWRQLANIIPGIDVGPMETFEAVTKAAGDRTSFLLKELDTLVTKPMPSENIEAFFKAVEEKSTEAAEKVAAIAGGKGGSAGPETISGFDPITAFNEEAAAKFEALDQSLLLEDERLMLAHENRQFIVEDAFQTGLINDARRNEILQNLEIEHQAKLGNLEAQGMMAREAFRKKSAVAKNRQVFGEIAQLTAGVAQSNKTLFEINKVAGIANAVVDTFRGVTRTMAEYPYPLNIGMAGLSFAAGLAQVNAIRSTSFGSGGGAPSIAGGGGGGSSTVNTIPFASQDASNDEAKTSSNETIVIQGVDPNKMFTGQQMRDMAEQLADVNFV